MTCILLAIANQHNKLLLEKIWLVNNMESSAMIEAIAASHFCPVKDVKLDD